MTKLSHGINEYGDDLLYMVKKQLGLTKPQLINFVNCPLTERAYREHLVKTGKVRPS